MGQKPAGEKRDGKSTESEKKRVESPILKV